MALSVDQVVSKERLLASAWSRLPERIRLLAIASTRGTLKWLEAVFASDGACQVQMVEALGMAAGVEKLRDELFDAIVIVHREPELNALDLVAALRAGGSEEPLIVLGTDVADEFLAEALEAGADNYLAIDETSVRALVWTLARSIERYALVRENRRLQQFEQGRTAQEERETQHLLTQQRAIVDELEALRQVDRDAKALDLVTPAAHARPDNLECAPELVEAYRHLLRSYVIMGAGSLAAEIERFAALLVKNKVSARRALELHLQAIEDLVSGLRSKSSRHVMNRAELLILEVMVHLAERYREGYDRSKSLG